MLAKGGGPQLPGMQGNLPTPDQFFGGAGMSGFPMPQQFLPMPQGMNFPTPDQLFGGMGGGMGGGMNGSSSNGGSGGSSGGGSDSMDGTQDARRGRDRSR